MDEDQSAKITKCQMPRTDLYCQKLGIGRKWQTGALDLDAHPLFDDFYKLSEKKDKKRLR